MMLYNHVREGTYETKTGKEIKPKKTVKDLGVLISKICPSKSTSMMLYNHVK